MLPLQLNSPIWAFLKDAYGSAEKIPILLAEVENANEECLIELFSRICHQMSVYSSSIAAFPHLINVASKLEANSEFQAELLCLAGSICESHEFAQELNNSDYAGALTTALPNAINFAETALSKTEDHHQAIYLLKAIAAFNHMQAIARIIEGFSNEEFTLECPSCSAELYIWPCDDGLFVAAEDPVFHKQTKRIFVAPRSPSTQSPCELLWLEQQISKAAGLANVHEKLKFLFGTATCPQCSQAFQLFEKLLEQAT